MTRAISKYLVITILLMSIPVGAQQNANVETYLQESLLLQYEFNYLGSENLTTSFGTFDDISSYDFVIDVADPMKENSSMVIKFNNQSYSVDDASLAEELGLQVGQHPMEFGFISLTEWNLIEQMVSQLESNSTNIGMGRGSELRVSTHGVEVIYIEMTDNLENQTINLIYEANSGILLFGQVVTATGGLQLQLLSIDEDKAWFDRFNIHTSNSSSISIPAGLYTVGFIVIFIFLPLMIYFFRITNRSGEGMLKSPKLAEISNIMSENKIFGHSSPENGKSITNKNKDAVDQGFINVAGYGRIRVCCNQTARLNEQYCPCGRSVPQKLRNLYNS